MGALPFLAHCRNPTEVTLQISTDTCDAGYVGTSITVVSTSTLAEARDGALIPAAETTACGPHGAIGSLVVVPGASGDGPFVVRVATGLDGVSADECAAPNPPSTCILATRELSLIDHTPLTLPIEMLLNCEGVVCAAGLTCVNGHCESDTLSSETCNTPVGCNLNADAGRSAGAPLDAGHDDAGHDSTSGSTDATFPADVGRSLDAAPAHDGGLGAGDATVTDAKGDAPGPPVACDGGVLCNGVCAPSCTTALATGQRWPWAIAVRDARVFWTTDCQDNQYGTNGAVLSTPVGAVGNVPAPVSLAIHLNGPSALAVNDDFVAWTNAGSAPTGTCDSGCNGSVMKVALSGGTPEVLDNKLPYPLGIALADASVYWVNNFTGSSSVATGSLVSEPLEGGPGKTLETELAFPGGIAVDGPRAYWTNFGPFETQTGSKGTVVTASRNGGAVITLADNQHYITNLTTGGDQVFWVTEGLDAGGTVMSVSKDGGAATAIATAQGDLLALTVDVTPAGTFVYWVDPTRGEVWRAKVGDAANPTLLATHQSVPTHVAVDDASVYWTNNGTCSDAGACSGSVMKFTPK